jgi:hypothetical protein
MARGGRGLVPHAVIEHLPYGGDVAGIAADQPRRDLVVDQVNQRGISAGAAGGVLALAPTDDTIVCLDAQDRRVEGRQPAEVAFVLTALLDRYANPPGSNGLYAHPGPPALRSEQSARVLMMVCFT